MTEAGQTGEWSSYHDLRHLWVWTAKINMATYGHFFNLTRDMLPFRQDRRAENIGISSVDFSYDGQGHCHFLEILIPKTCNMNIFENCRAT